MFDSDSKAVSLRLLLHLLKEAQYSELTASLENKIIHGVFYKLAVPGRGMGHFRVPCLASRRKGAGTD